MTFHDPVHLSQTSTFSLFSREEFKQEFDQIDAEHTKLDDRGDVDLTAWIKHRGAGLLNLLRASPEHYEEMRHAIHAASPGEVLRIARNILAETA